MQRQHRETGRSRVTLGQQVKLPPQPASGTAAWGAGAVLRAIAHVFGSRGYAVQAAAITQCQTPSSRFVVHDDGVPVSRAIHRMVDCGIYVRMYAYRSGDVFFKTVTSPFIS